MVIREMLTPKQQKFVDAYSLSGNATQAALVAGYSERTACKIGSENLQKPDIQSALAERQAEYAAELELSKQGVFAQVLEAIEMGKVQQRPEVLIQGATALARLCGFFEPARGAVEVSNLDVSAIRRRFASMSDSELLALASGRLFNTHAPPVERRFWLDSERLGTGQAL